MGSREKLKALDLYYHNASDHQTKQGGDLNSGAPTHKVKQPFDQVVLRNYVTN